MAQLVESFYHQNPDELGESIAEFSWKGVKYPLYVGNNIIGRKGKNARIDVKLDHLSISDLHAEIEQIDDEFYIRDLRSDHGTSVEVLKSAGAKQFVPLTRQSVKLFHGAKIHIGSLECYFNFTNEKARVPTIGIASSAVNFSSPNSSDTEITTEVPTQIVDETLIHHSLVEEHCSELPQDADPEDTIDNNVISPKKYNKRTNNLICHSQNSGVAPMRLASVASSVCDENTQFFTGVDEDDEVELEKSVSMEVTADTQYLPPVAEEEEEEREEFTAVEVDELLKSAPDDQEDDDVVAIDGSKVIGVPEGTATAMEPEPDVEEVEDVDSDATDMEDNVVAEDHPVAVGTASPVRYEDYVSSDQPGGWEDTAMDGPLGGEAGGENTEMPLDGYESEESADLINITSESQGNKSTSGIQKGDGNEVAAAKTISNVTALSMVQSFSPSATTATCSNTYMDPIPVIPVIRASSLRAVPPVEEATYLTETYLQPPETQMEHSTSSSATVAQTIPTAVEATLVTVNETKGEDEEEVVDEVITAPETLSGLQPVVTEEVEVEVASEPPVVVKKRSGRAKTLIEDDAASVSSAASTTGGNKKNSSSNTSSSSVAATAAVPKKGSRQSTLEAIAEEMVKVGNAIQAEQEASKEVEVAVTSTSAPTVTAAAATATSKKYGRGAARSSGGGDIELKSAVVDEAEAQSVASDEVKLPAKKGRKGAAAAAAATKPNEAVTAAPEPELPPPPVATAAAPSRGKKRSAAVAEIAPEPEDISEEKPVAASSSSSSPVKKSKANHTTAAVVPSPSNSSTAGGGHSVVRILFTGMDKEKEHLAMVKALRNAVVTEDPTEATHLIPGADLKRTAKFMIALNSGVAHVVTLNWLIDSSKSKQKEPIDLTAKDNLRKYEYVHKEKEQLWNFNLSHSLSLPRGEGTVGVYSGYAYFMWPGVCGNGAPGVEDMKSIIISGGGMWLDSLDIYHNTPERVAAQDTIITSKGKSKVAVPPLPGIQVLPLIVVITDAVYNTASQAVSAATKKGKNAAPATPEEYIQILSFLVQKNSKTEVLLYTCEFLFLGSLRQQLDFKHNQLDIGKLLPVSASSSSSAVAEATGKSSSRRK